MGRLALCVKLPCVLHPAIQAADPSTGWERATPFLIGALILAVSIATTRAVIEKAEARMTRGWTPEKLKLLEGHGITQSQAPTTLVVGLPWVVDVAQIPALLGTPLAGIFILKHHSNILLLYTTVLAAGLIVFFGYYLMGEINDYDRFALKFKKYRLTAISGGAILLNLICAAIAMIA